MKLKNLDISIMIPNLLNNMLGLTKIELTKELAKEAKTKITVKYRKYEKGVGTKTEEMKKEKLVKNGKLYYVKSSENGIGNDKGDLRITYYKFKTDNMITCIGAKRDNQTIFAAEILEGKQKDFFKCVGENMNKNDFIKLIKAEGQSVNVLLVIFSILFLVVAAFLAAMVFLGKDNKNHSSLIENENN